jgi:hypothetical protein
MVGINSSKLGLVGSYKAVMGRQASYWSNAKASREALGSAMSATRSTLNSVSNSFAQVQADKISGMANLSAQAALDRINTQRKAQSASILKQVDGVQASIDKAKAEAAIKAKYYVYTMPLVPLVDVSTVDTKA